MVSSTTSVLPLRVPNELLERLEALVAHLHTTRTDVGRDALQRGLELLEAQLASRKEARAARRKPNAPAARTSAAAEPAPARGRKRRTAAEPPSAVKPDGRTRGKRQAASAKSASTEAPPEAEFDLVAFAAQVLEAAQRTKTGRYGDDRVFINHAWRQYKREQRPKGMDLEAFKLRLVEVNRDGLLSLVRADMAPILDQRNVEEAEIRHLSATFHFLCI